MSECIATWGLAESWPVFMELLYWPLLCLGRPAYHRTCCRCSCLAGLSPGPFGPRAAPNSIRGDVVAVAGLLLAPNAAVVPNGLAMWPKRRLEGIGGLATRRLAGRRAIGAQIGGTTTDRVRAPRLVVARLGFAVYCRIARSSLPPTEGMGRPLFSPPPLPNFLRS